MVVTSHQFVSPTSLSLSLHPSNTDVADPTHVLSKAHPTTRTAVTMATKSPQQDFDGNEHVSCSQANSNDSIDY